MFLFSKVYAQFDHDFWTSAANQIILARSDKRGHYPLWMRYRNAPKGKNLFMCYIGGAEAARVEGLSSDQIKDEIESHFRKCLGKVVSEKYSYEQNDKTMDGAFRPVAVAKTDWSSTPQFCGSYSSFPVHAFSDTPMEDLEKPLAGSNGADRRSETLFFAGEGYDKAFNGWVQGAYFSGERVAEKILGLKAIE